MSATTDQNGWLPTDYDLLLELAREGRFRAEDLAAVMAAESDLRCEATSGSGATGLTQMMPGTLKALGWERDPAYAHARGDLCAAPLYVQLQYASKYFNGWRHRFRLPRWESRTQLFLANFLPAELGHADEPGHVIAADQGKRPLVYRQNRTLDRDRNGRIEVAEAEAFVVEATRTRARARYVTAMAGLALARARRGEEDEAPTSIPSPGLRDHGDVRAVQVTLARLGYAPGPFDGLRGVLTRMAVLRFQKDEGLRGDGIVGPITWHVLALRSAA